MPIETYTFEVAESPGGEGITADVYDSDGLVLQTVRVSYDDYENVTAPDGETPAPHRVELTADVLSLSLQYEVTDAGIAFQVVGDGDILLTERADADEWGIRPNG